MVEKISRSKKTSKLSSSKSSGSKPECGTKLDSSVKNKKFTAQRSSKSCNCPLKSQQLINKESNPTNCNDNTKNTLKSCLKATSKSQTNVFVSSSDEKLNSSLFVESDRINKNLIATPTFIALGNTKISEEHLNKLDNFKPNKNIEKGINNDNLESLKKQSTNTKKKQIVITAEVVDIKDFIKNSSKSNVSQPVTSNEQNKIVEVITLCNSQISDNDVDGNTSTKSSSDVNIPENILRQTSETDSIDSSENIKQIPEVLRKQGTASLCSSNENNCPCNTMEGVEEISKQINYCNRKTWITVDRMNELRKRAQDALKNHKTFTIRGCFFSVRNALASRGWVEKLDVHRKQTLSGVCQVTYEDLSQCLPKRRAGESRRQYVIKCERNIMSRFLEHMPIDFLWTARKEKCDYIDQAKNPSMIINKFHRIPFTSKEGLCAQLKDFYWFYEEYTSEVYFPRCYNASSSPEELCDFLDNFRTSACIGFLRWLVDKFRANGFDAVFTPAGKIPFTAIDFAFQRCNEYLDSRNNIDIDDSEDKSFKIWEHDWDNFLTQHFMLTQESSKICSESNRILDPVIKNAERVLDMIEEFWPQYNLDGYLNLWIIKPANKCRGRGILLMDNLKKIMHTINPAISTKSRYVVQKYIEKPLIIHNTKFDIRQWFLVTQVQPMVIWIYKESYLRFSSQEFNLASHHESVHLTNHAVQKKYKNGKRDKRLPSENMWDCFSFQAYLRQIGHHEMWSERIYPGMKKAIIGTMLASQDNMDRRSNTFELFGADFMITEDFYPWLIEINSSPDLGATTSVTARMCPAVLEDVIKVVIDRRNDPKAETGNFELIYRQVVPPTPAYMGLNLFLKGKSCQLPKNHQHHNHHRKDHNYSQRSISSIQIQRQSMPTINFQSSPLNSFPSGLDSDDENFQIPITPKLMMLRKSSLANLNILSSSTDNLHSPTVSNLQLLPPTCFQNSAGHYLTPLPTRSATQIISPRKYRRNDVLQNKRVSLPTNNLLTPFRNNFIINSKSFVSSDNVNFNSQSPTHDCIPMTNSDIGNVIKKGMKTKENQSKTSNKNSFLGTETNINGKDNFVATDNVLTNESNENLFLNISEDKSLNLSDRSSTPKNRKEIFELLCKTKLVKSATLQRNSVLNYRKKCLKRFTTNNDKLTLHNQDQGNTKNVGIKNNLINDNFQTIGLSLRHMRSKQNLDCKNSTKNRELCQSAPTTLETNEKFLKRQLCKNLSKKFSTNRVNTRC